MQLPYCIAMVERLRFPITRGRGDHVAITAIVDAAKGFLGESQVVNRAGDSGAVTCHL